MARKFGDMVSRGGSLIAIAAMDRDVKSAFNVGKPLFETLSSSLLRRGKAILNVLLVVPLSISLNYFVVYVKDKL